MPDPSDTPLIYTKKGNLPMQEMEYETAWREPPVDSEPIQRLLVLAMTEAFLRATEIGTENITEEKIQKVSARILEVLNQQGLVRQAIVDSLPPWTKMVETYKQGEEILRESAHVFARKGLSSEGKAQKLR